MMFVTATTPTPNLKRILVVEDEIEIRKLIALHLKREGFAVDEVGDGEDAKLKLEQSRYDVIVLDWMLPSLSGPELTRALRQGAPVVDTPILFVTARAEPEDIAGGLDAGADDYLTKPFDPKVLLARVNALMRRREWLNRVAERPGAGEPSRLTVGDLTLDTTTYAVSLAGQPLELTRSEFRLLESLMLHQGKVLSREALIGEIQGEGVNVVGRTVDTHVFGLRKKLGAMADMIETIRGVGYRVRYLPAHA